MKRQNETLDLEFFSRPTEKVAVELLGQVLVSEFGGKRTSGIIVETEAYLPKGDSACHAAKSRTARTEVMFGRAGMAYVYPIHAKHCFNIVSDKEELGCAVLIRALEPVEGIDVMKKRRGLDNVKRLTTGPACLCQALAIQRDANGTDLCTSDKLFVDRGDKIKRSKILETVRIGVTSAKDLKLRFVVANNQYVSGPKRLRCS